MLDNDQYNQEEYNNYYKQVTEGAEIKGYNNQEGGFLKKAILFLGVAALAIAGYFGLKMFNSSSKNDNNPTEEQIVIKEDSPQKNETNEETTTTTNSSKESSKKLNSDSTEVEEKIQKTIHQEVTEQVEKKLKDSKKVSSDDISKIVDIVMSKMEKEKTTQTDNDTNLVSALQNNDSDSVEAKTNEKIEPINTNIETSIQKNPEELNSNNKVTLDNNTNDKDNLNELSQQIKKILNMVGANDKPNNIKSTHTISEEETTETSSVAPESSSNQASTDYEQSITQEIDVRTNEMRVIEVKPGDTLNKIAKRAYGDADSYKKILDANPQIIRADRIYVGQKLRIPE